MGKLTAKGVTSTDTPGRHSDGGNLYLNVSTTGSKSWTFFYRHQGKLREIGLGSVRDVSLAQARKIAAGHQHRLKHEGVEPAGKRTVVSDRKPQATTFGDVAAATIEAKRSEWRNARGAPQWERSLAQHAGGLMKLPVDKIDTEALLGVLKPIWQDRWETANRLRNRIERVLAVAAVMGLRPKDAPNPARWKNHLELLLPRRQKAAKQHLAAMAFTDVPAFMEKLRARSGISPLALEFAILAGGRTDETLSMTWGEIDLERAIWTIPSSRMKAGVQHRVPLSERALSLLQLMQADRETIQNLDSFVFHGRDRGAKLGHGMLLQCLRKMGVSTSEATVHGFRSSFRDWAGKQKQWPREWAELSLAHSVGNATERSYWRDDLLEERRPMMQAWADYCSSAGGNVVQLRQPA